MSVSLSVIIVTHNSEKFLSDCLHSVVSQQMATPFEVFVVDNASSDGTRHFIRSTFSTVRLLENDHNKGFAAANNDGLRA